MTKNGWRVSVLAARTTSIPSTCIYSDLFPGWPVAKWNCEVPSFHKFQQFINWLQKFATWNRK